MKRDEKRENSREREKSTSEIISFHKFGVNVEGKIIMTRKK